MGEVNAMPGDGAPLLITGAAGFIGGAALAEARRRGIPVRAVLRGAAPAGWADDPGIQPIRADLSDPASAPVLADAARACAGVIHAAAHMGGDSASHASDTLAATGQLLAALPPRTTLVLVSSITVYDLGRAAPGSSIDETSPLNRAGAAQDAYAEAKLAQEALCRDSGLPLWLMRPGAVWGPGRSWHALNGFRAGKLHVTLTSDGELPLVHVTAVARALVDAALSDPAGVTALNLLDDDRPTRARFARAHRAAAGWPRLQIPLPWTLWLGLTRALAPLAPRLPGLLREPVLRARIMPLRWPNRALRERLGGADAAPFEEMLNRTLQETS